MLKNFRIGVRLAGGFSIILMLLVAVSWVGIHSMELMDNSAMHIVKRNYSRIEFLSHARENISENFQAIAVILTTTDKAREAKELKKYEDGMKEMETSLEEYKKLQDHKEMLEQMTKMQASLEKMKEANIKVIRLSTTGNVKDEERARAVFMNECMPADDAFQAEFEPMVKYEENRIGVRYKEMLDEYKSSVNTMMAVGVVSVVLVILLSFFLTRGITKPLDMTVKAANAVAEGDLTIKVDVDSKDEVGQLASAINRMVLGLRDMIGSVNQTAAQVAAAADQVKASSVQIEKGAQVQATAADETSSSMEEMAASIQQVALNANNLSSNVDETSASINQMVASIEQVAKNSGSMASSVSETSATIEQMAVSIDQVAKDAENLAASVEETSATVEQMMVSIEQVGRNSDMLSSTVAETSSTVEEMAASIKEVSKNVSEADKLSQRAADDAKAGAEAVELTIEGIGKIADSMNSTTTVIGSLGRRSEEIGKIIGVIEDIADQTNLLALNAAIEAARAGDAGRGFAVVADEVRKLAERSVVATKEIGEVIKQVQVETAQAVRTAEDGARETVEGKKLADRAGAALKRIYESVGATNHIMAEINNAAIEQSTAATQVMRSVENMNGATDSMIKAVKEQAIGSKQIRTAVEAMNRTTRQVALAVKEQAAGGKQIRVAVEDMNRIVNQVNIAAKEQAAGSTQIMKSVENMNNMTRDVAGATSEQKRSGEFVVKAVENISGVARENLAAVKQLVGASENISTQAEELEKSISVFKTSDVGLADQGRGYLRSIKRV